MFVYCDSKTFSGNDLKYVTTMERETFTTSAVEDIFALKGQKIGNYDARSVGDLPWNATACFCSHPRSVLRSKEILINFLLRTK